jgi:hypothetical protein
LSQEDITTLIQEASKYSYVKDGLVYLKSYLNYPDRKIGEVKESEESSIKYFVDRFEIARRKVNELSKAIEEAQNKGSYLMKLIHLKDYLAKFDAIGNYVELLDRLDQEEEKLQEIISVNKVKNLEIKKALIEEAKLLLNSNDWDVVSEKFKELRTKWIKTGNTSKEENDQLEQEFKDLIETFFANRKQFYEDRNREIIERVNYFTDLLKTAEGLLKEEKTPDSIRKMKSIQQEWKNIGKLPKQKKKQLNDTFRFVTSKFFVPKGGASSYGSQDRNGIDPTLRAWEALANQAEELSKNFANDSLRKIKDIQSRWQALGQINKKKRGAFNLIEKFRTSVSKVYEYEFLNKTALRKFGLYFRKPEVEQLKLKVSLMNELIGKANAELKVFEDNLQNMAPSRDQEMNKLISSKLNAQKRKIEIMHIILEELNFKLNELR